MTMDLSSEDDFVGRVVLGRYRIVRPIGRGGMGIVFLARSEGAAGFVKPVVIKRTLPHGGATADARAQLSGREARIMSNLRHPGIVSVLDFAENEGKYLLVLDYVHGYNLAQWHRFLRQGGRLLSWEIACHVLASVLDALHYAHTLVGPDGEPLQVIHRDVSPANVLIDVAGHVKLADFGIARMQTDHTEDSSTLALKGKMSYMAPELLRQEQPGPASDIYACGVLLHELIIGTNEMRASDLVQTSTRVLWHVLSAPSASRDDVPKELDAILARSTAKSPEARFATALEFAQALRALQTKPPDGLTALVAAQAAEDFGDPEMAKQLGMDGLSTLERAWRQSPPIGNQEDENSNDARRKREATVPLLEEDRLPSVHVLFSPLPTAPVIPSSLPIQPPAAAPARRALPSWTTLLFATVVATVVAGTIALLVGRRTQRGAGDDRIIVVQSQAGSAAPYLIAQVPEAAKPGAIAADHDGTEMPKTGAAPAAPSAAGPAANARPHAKRATAGRADIISRTFARQKGQVAQCFAATRTEPGGGDIAVRFEIDTQGKVVAASVLPPGIAATPLGECIVRVALSIDFGPQPEPLSFRVPISARRVP
jgi:eukaryotic-like serine/threonine-protein kinase